MNTKPKSGFEIVPAQIFDSYGIAKIQVEAWRVAYRGIVPDSILDSLSVEEKSEIWKEKIKDAIVKHLVCKVSDEIVGYTNYGDPQFDKNSKDYTQEIWGLYVAPKHFRQGFGTILMNEAESKIAESEYKRIVLHCFQKNDSSMKFYRKNGYRLTGKSLPHPRFNEQLLVEYEKRIN